MSTTLSVKPKRAPRIVREDVHPVSSLCGCETCVRKIIEAHKRGREAYERGEDDSAAHYERSHGPGRMG